MKVQHLCAWRVIGPQLMGRSVRRLHAIIYAIITVGAMVGCEPTSRSETGSVSELPITVPLEQYVGRLVTVTAMVGGDTVNLLLDTGGGQTLITPQVAEQLGCTPRGRSVGFRMSGERVEFARCDSVIVEIGGQSFEHPEIGVWDLMAILPEGLPRLDGLLALNTFADTPFTLDLDGQELTLETASSLEIRVRDMSPVRARVATGPSGGDVTVFVHGVIDAPGWFLLDTGNLDVVQVAQHLVGATGPVPREADSVTLTLTGLAPSETTIRIVDIIYDGTLSEQLLREWVWTFHLGTGDVWAAPRQ